MSVSVEGLTRRFSAASTPAVNGVSFQAPGGAITALLGPSGSGKTTVLRMIAGLEVPDAGTVKLAGLDCTRTPVRMRGVGFVFQGYALFEHMSVAKNVGFGLALKKLPKQEIAKRVEELLALVQLEGMGSRLPAQLSGGQRQRVAFARALATEPRVLLLDEPFGALDARVRVELRQFLLDLHARTHVTTLFVTHDQDEALELSDHVVVMNAGRVEQAGTPHEIYDQPHTPFVASFIGAANMLRGHIREGRATIGGTHLPAPSQVRDGAPVNAWVRPHDVRLQRPSEDAPPLSLGQIVGVVRVGGTTKVTVRMPSSEQMAVELPKSEFDALAIAEGDRVMVDLKAARIFVEDYSI